jgi:NAD(P) transhydrogenase subunit alpha
MMGEWLIGIYVFALASLLGFELITRVPPTLHTPLMSGANAISGISLIGAILVGGSESTTLVTVLAGISIAMAAVNVVGGFLMTDRMLRMFRKD